jgi:hypothetical protein
MATTWLHGSGEGRQGTALKGAQSDFQLKKKVRGTMVQ